MHTKELTPVVGRVYKFDYKGVSRVVVACDVGNGHVAGYDFVRGGWRNFTESKVQNAEDVTDKALILEDSEWTEALKAKMSRVYKVFVDNDDTLYAVNL